MARRVAISVVALLVAGEAFVGPTTGRTMTWRRATVSEESSEERRRPVSRERRVLELSPAMQLKRKAPPEREAAARAPPPSSSSPSSSSEARAGPGARGAAAAQAAEEGKAGRGARRQKTEKTYEAPRRRVEATQQFRGARGSLKKRRNRGDRETKEKEEEPAVALPEGAVGVSALAELLGKSGTEVVKVLMLKMGILASVTQTVEASTARAVVEAFGREVAGEDEAGGDDPLAASVVVEDEEAEMVPRAPVVTIMGHVDHGKTSLLDAIRETRVAAGEAGGITQGIGAYSVKDASGREITFIDTPGHAAFSDMRARGANVTDIVVLVVAADDGVKAQTVDSIACAKRAGVSVVVAVNKMDVDGADPTKVENELMGYDLVPEEYGGETLVARVSAKTRENLDDLLEKIWLQADLLDLRANPAAEHASGVVVEASVEKGLGVVATTLVQRGTLEIGDTFAAGSAYGKVRALMDDAGSALTEAGPSTAARVVGWQSGADRAPSAGDAFQVCRDEQTARKLADARHAIASDRRASRLRDAQTVEFGRFVGTVGGDSRFKERRLYDVVVKADCAGSVEALEAALAALDVEDDVSRVDARVVYSGVGDVTKSDVAVAAVSRATILAFNVGAHPAAVEAAHRDGLAISYYAVVYDALDDLSAHMLKILSPTPDGKLVGTATIKQLFDIGKLGKVAGCGVTTGTIKKSANFRLMRGDQILFQGKLRTLRNVKTDVDRVQAPSDCGLSFADFDAFDVGDVLECYDPAQPDD